MAYTIDELKVAAQKAIKLMEEFESVNVPETIKDAVDGDWVGVIEDVAAFTFGRLDRKFMREMGTRCITIEKANALLVELEDETVKAYLKESHSLLYSFLKDSTAIPRWVLSNISILWSVVLPILAEFVGVVAEYEIEKAAFIAKTTLIQLSDSSIHPLPDNEREALYQEALRHYRRAEYLESEVMFAVIAVTGVAAWLTYESVITVCKSSGFYGIEMGTLRKIRQQVMLKIPANMMPQRHGPRWRRRKRSSR